MKFKLASTKPVDEFREAAALGIHTRPVLLGPLSFLLLGKSKTPKLKLLRLLDAILPLYEEVLWQLAHAGADWVQIDEPVLALDLPHEVLNVLESSCARLSAASDQLRICLATYFAGLGDNLAGRAAAAGGRRASRSGAGPSSWSGRWRPRRRV